MGNELEDFLKRAAQRRAEHVAVRGEQQKREQERPTQSRGSEYTNRNRERTATLVDDDEDVIVAEVVPAVLAGKPAFSAGGLAERHLSKMAESKVVDQAYAPAPSQTPGTGDRRAEQGSRGAWEARFDNNSVAATAGPTAPSHSASASVLIKLLKSPDGVRQAFLMREILDRPVDRW